MARYNGLYVIIKSSLIKLLVVQYEHHVKIKRKPEKEVTIPEVS